MQRAPDDRKALQYSFLNAASSKERSPSCAVMPATVAETPYMSSLDDDHQHTQAVATHVDQHIYPQPELCLHPGELASRSSGTSWCSTFQPQKYKQSAAKNSINSEETRRYPHDAAYVNCLSAARDRPKTATQLADQLYPPSRLWYVLSND